MSVSRVWLEPSDSHALPLALARIAEADLVVLGPGSLFTSVMPNILVGGMREALAETGAPVVYVANLMKPGETANLSGPDHLRALIEHLGEGVVDTVLVNSAPVPDGALERYGDTGAEPVVWPAPPAAGEDGAGAETVQGVTLVRGDLLRVSGHVRHDPAALAGEVLALRRGPAVSAR